MSYIVNLSAYQFCVLPQTQLQQLKTTLINKLQFLQLKGTILLSTEGINITLSGEKNNIAYFQYWLPYQLPQFKTMEYRKTYSTFIPFQRCLVKIKKQIIAFSHFQNNNLTIASYITPTRLFDWMHTNYSFLLLDVRNDYEIAQGRFYQAVSLHLKHFRDFPKAAKMLPKQYKTTPIVTVCTGGIRCEKASKNLLQQGFKEVYQLKGGILHYFEQYKNQYYEGGCFVFDERQTLYPNNR